MQFLFVTRGDSIRIIDRFIVRSCCEIRNENPTYALKAFICIFRNGPTSQCIMKTPLDDGVSIHEVYSEPSTVASMANVKVHNDGCCFS